MFNNIHYLFLWLIVYDLLQWLSEVKKPSKPQIPQILIQCDKNNASEIETIFRDNYDPKFLRQLHKNWKIIELWYYRRIKPKSLLYQKLTEFIYFKNLQYLKNNSNYEIIRLNTIGELNCSIFKELLNQNNIPYLTLDDILGKSRIKGYASIIYFPQTLMLNNRTINFIIFGTLTWKRYRQHVNLLGPGCVFSNVKFSGVNVINSYGKYI